MEMRMTHRQRQIHSLELAQELKLELLQETRSRISELFERHRNASIPLKGLFASFGNVIHLDIDKKGNVLVSPIDSSFSTIEELENNLLLFSTGIKRETIEILTDQKKNAEADEEKMKQMHLIKEIGEEIKKALEIGQPSKVGKWLNVHWEAKKNFSKKMSSDTINKAYEIGVRNGALGGKLVGAGGGGFLMFYCENHKPQLRTAMEKLGLKEMPFRFDREGCKVLYQGR